MRGRRTTGLYHGECVALGMLPMIEDPALVKRVRAVYRTLGLPTRAGANKDKVLAYMQHDKKSQRQQPSPSSSARAWAAGGLNKAAA